MNIKKMTPVVVFISGVLLSACSSNPSPWEVSEATSPWDNRATAETEVVEAYQSEPVPYEVVEPMGAVEDEASPVEMESIALEEVMAEPMIEESMAAEQIDEPVAVVMLDEESSPLAGNGLASQPAGNYAVQVVASSSAANLSSFCTQYNISEQWIAETTVGGKVWFVLMSGVYETKSEAVAAKSSLSEMGTAPWVRTVGSIQAVMN